MSELAPETTCDDMIVYVTSRLDIPSTEVICQILINRNQKREELEFVSFKIGLKEDIISYSLESDFWPDGTVVREFQERQRTRPNRLS